MDKSVQPKRIKKLSVAECFFIEHNRNLDAKEISRHLKRPVKQVQKELDRLDRVKPIEPPPVEHSRVVAENSKVHKPNKEAKRKLFGERDGVAISTPLASEMGDEQNPMQPTRPSYRSGKKPNNDAVYRPFRQD